MGFWNTQEGSKFACRPDQYQPTPTLTGCPGSVSVCWRVVASVFDCGLSLTSVDLNLMEIRRAAITSIATVRKPHHTCNRRCLWEDLKLHSILQRQIKVSRRITTPKILQTPKFQARWNVILVFMWQKDGAGFQNPFQLHHYGYTGPPYFCFFGISPRGCFFPQISASKCLVVRFACLFVMS